MRRALAADEPWLLDLRAQHGVGADAVDALGRFYELKAYGGAEPDTVQLTPAEVQRAMGNDAFFLVVVSGLGAGTAPVSVRIVPDPIRQLTWRPSTNVNVTGIRTTAGMLFRFEAGGPGEHPDGASAAEG